MKFLPHFCVYGCDLCMDHVAEDVSFIHSKINGKGTDLGNRIKRTWWLIGLRQWGNWDELTINHRFLAWLTGWRVLPFPETGDAVRACFREWQVQSEHAEAEVSVRCPSGDILKAITWVWTVERGSMWQCRDWVHWQRMWWKLSEQTEITRVE